MDQEIFNAEEHLEFRSGNSKKVYIGIHSIET